MKKLLRLAPLVFTAVALAQAPAETAKKAPPADPTVALEKKDNGTFRQRHEAFLKRGQEGPIHLLFLGDSITAGWANAGKNVWHERYAPLHAANFGIGGDQTQHVIWRIENGELEGIKPRVVVLMIGTNNSAAHSAEQIAAANEKIIRLIRAKLPETKVLLLAIFPRGPRKNQEGVLTDAAQRDFEKRMATIRGVNARLAQLDDGRHVRFLDIGPKFLNAEGQIPESIMPDQLHLTEAGYKIWADAMQPLLGEMMKE